MRKGSPDSRSSARGEAGVPGEHCRPGTEPVLQGAWGLPPAVRPTDALVTGTKSPGKASQGRTAEKNGFCVAQGTQSNRSSGSCSWSLTWVGHPQRGGNLGPQAGGIRHRIHFSSFHFSESQVRRLNIYWNTFYAPRHLQTDTMLIPKLREMTHSRAVVCCGG